MNLRFRILITLICSMIQAHAQSKLERGKSLFDQKKYSEVKTILEAIKSDDTDFAASQYYLGRVAFIEKKYDDAASYFKEAAETNNKVAEYQVWLGDTYG